MADIANRDEARKCLAMASNAMRDGDFDKAERLASKARRLYASIEAESMLETISAARASAAGSSHRSAQQHRDEPSMNGHTSRHGHSSHSRHHHEPESRGDHGHSAGQQHASSSAGQQHTGSASHAGPKLPPRPNQGETLRHRAAAQPQEDKGTPEQKALVQQIIKAKDFYEILGIAKTATDDDIKKAYRKLALKLHPDKNSALHAEEAFKLVSKAFSCLSDSSKRAYYDRTGYESSAAAAAAAAAQRSPSSGHHHRQHAAQYAYGEEIDPEEIFNMFFGGAFPGHARVFRTQFGGPPRRHHQQQQANPQQAAEQQQRAALLSLLQFLPVLLVIAFTFFSGSHTPMYSLSRDHTYQVEMHTARLNVPFYVKSQVELDRAYPANSHARVKLERGVEGAFYERLEQKCQQERLLRHRAWSWGNREQARAMKLESCEEIERLNEKLGVLQRQNRGSGYY